MLAWLFKWVLLSMILIVLIHYLYCYFINTLTVPRVKDLINKPIEQYTNITSILNNEKDSGSNTENMSNDVSNNMKDELTNFLNNMKMDDISSSDILKTSNYSNY